MRLPKYSYIYGLKDPRDGQIYYIGKSNDPKRRKREHLENRDCNAQRVAWLEDLRSSCLEPELVVLAKVECKDWQESEIYWIARGHEEGWPLTNIHKGGNGRRFELAQPDYNFMRSYIRPDLWARFDSLSIREKDRVCLETAGVMADSYLPFLGRKMKMKQYAMLSLISDELVSIGMKKATAIVEAGILGA